MHSKAQQDAISTFENNCLEGNMTFGDPFEDSGVKTTFDSNMHAPPGRSRASCGGRPSQTPHLTILDFEHSAFDHSLAQPLRMRRQPLARTPACSSPVSLTLHNLP